MRYIWIACLSFCLPAFAENPLAPVRVDSPRATMQTFMESMTSYKIAKVGGKMELANEQLDKAVRTLNLSQIAPLVQQEQGREAAIFLKEVIDRVIVIDYNLIPQKISDDDPPWALKGTDIRISKVIEGEHKGEYLFTPSTVAQARLFFSKVKHLPYKEGTTMGAAYQEPWLQAYVPSWAKHKVLFIANWQWLGLFVAIFLGLALRVLGRALNRFVRQVVEKAGYVWNAEVIEKTEQPWGLLAACSFWYFSVYLLGFEGTSRLILLGAVQIVLSIAVIWAAYLSVDVLTHYLTEKAKKTETEIDNHIMPLVRKSARIFIVVVGVLLLVQNLGVNVMSLVAGLGLGGLAFALAAKDTCANLFGSIMILLDRPFKVGDWIQIDGVDGTVEEIGFRSTRLRTFYNSLVSIPNSLVANANIDNYGLREYRRVVAKFGLVYDTTAEQMEAFLEGVKQIILANEYTRKDMFHVVFNEYKGDCLEVMAYFFFKVPTWSEELVQRQNIYLEILRYAKEVGVEFAFPTQTLHVESMPGHEPMRKPGNAKGYKSTEFETIATSFGPNGNKAMPKGLGIYRPPYEN